MASPSGPSAGGRGQQHNGSAADGTPWATRRDSGATPGTGPPAPDDRPPGMELVTCDSESSAEMPEAATATAGGGGGGGGGKVKESKGSGRTRKQHSVENGPSSGTDPVSNSDSKDVNVDFSNANDAQSPVSKSKVDMHNYFTQNMSAPYTRLEHPADRSLMVSFIGSLFFLLVALIVFCPTAVFVLLFLPLSALIKQCMLCCCCATPKRTCLCCCSRMLSHTDALWLHDTKLNRAIMHSLVTLEVGLDVARIRDLINAKLISAEGHRGNRLYPRFMQKVVPMKTGFRWETDENFNIDKHVYPMPNTIHTQADLESHIAAMAATDFPPDQPLWDLQVLQDFGDKKDTIILLRVHQCMCDGVALIHILLDCLVDEYSLYSMKPRFSRGAFLLNSLRAIAIGPLVFLHRWLLTRKDYNLIHATPRTGKKVVAWSEPYSVGRAIRIKQVTRSTLNDVLLSVASGCVRTYLQSRGVGNPYDMLASIPLDLRTSSCLPKMGSRMAYVDLTLPTNTEGSIPRLWEIRQKMEHVKKSADSFIMYGAQWLLTLILPACLMQRLWSSLRGNATCLIANLPGPESQVHFASRQVKSVINWMPPPDEVALSISFLTYGDQLRMSVIADEGVVSDPTVLTKDFILQLEKLSHLLSHRRIPGEHPGRRIDHLHDDGLQREPTVEELQAKMAAVQQQLQDLKARLDTEDTERYSEEERALVDRVEQLKEEFRELLAELRRKRIAQGSSVLSDDSRPQHHRSLSA